MKVDKIYWWLFSIFLNIHVVLSFNILAVFPYQGKSHFFVFEPYLKELARRGHNLTVVSFFPQPKPIENYHDINLADKSKVFENVIPIEISIWTGMQLLSDQVASVKENCKALIENDNVKKMWSGPSEFKFDLVVTEQFFSDCALGLAYKLGAPVVGMTSHVLMPWHYSRFGIEYNPSYVPVQFLGGGTRPNLGQRITRFIMHHFTIFLYRYISQSANQKQLQEYFDVPPLEELGRDIKILLLYTNFVVSGSSLYPPNVVEVGGYHVAKPKELSPELKKFIDDSEHGVIYISFGSMLQAASTPRDKVEAIVAALSELPQRVIWKWDEKTLPGNPQNVYLAKWLSQNDILAHPNVLAFYSHCGMLSTTEAIYHGVPMIGMPIFGDQPSNAAAIEENGLGLQIQMADLTKENLLEKLKIILDPEFRKQVKELSKVWHDRPMSAMDTAIYWTEFVARNKNFTFRSPTVTVPLYQYFYLDLIAVVIGVLIAFVISLKILLLLCKSRSPKVANKVKVKKS